MLQARSHLFCAWRSEDGAGDASGEEAVAYEASKSWLVARSTTADDGDIMGLGERRGIAVDDFVGSVEEERWIGKGEGMEGRKDGVSGISEVVL